MSKLVLASASQARRIMLENAGLHFEVLSSRIDERSVEKSFAVNDTDPEDIALVLAMAKAEDVSGRKPGCWVIGADQLLSLDGEVLHKPDDMEGARRRLLLLSGRTHRLNTAIALVRDGEVVWTVQDHADITMRELNPREIGRNLAMAGEAVLGSVGAYQIEGPGLQLIKDIKGDFFTIMGMPLLALLEALRENGVLPQDPLSPGAASR